MPVYEYYCPDCHGVFELLRPTRLAQEPQPCPECDADCDRLMPTSFNAFTQRDGVPRKLPDRGTYWHHGKEVSRRIDTTIQMGEHPELMFDKYGPDPVLTVEEEEAQAYRIEQRLEREAEAIASRRPVPTDLYARHEANQFMKRRAATAQRARLAKRRAPNAKTTPRTASGEHQPGTIAKRRPPGSATS